MTTLSDHLKTGLTTVCRAWAVTRRDGVTLGFTDHDRPLTFDGITFRADAGMTAKALTSTTGLSVDNTEVMGILSDPAISESDIAAGRYDGAEVRSWLVNWADPTQRQLRFQGTIGEIRRSGGAFTADLRGLSEGLNQPIGRSFSRNCSAVLGDQVCRFDLTADGYSASRPATGVLDRRRFVFTGFSDFEQGWFERGQFRVLTGQAAGLNGLIKRDYFDAENQRHIELWQPLGADVSPGDDLQIIAGCDKRFSTCRFKFANAANFAGFPDIPGEDWLISTPLTAGVNDGGSLRG